MKAAEFEQGQESLVNRTGIMTHPEQSAELIQGAKESVPSSGDETTDMASSRAIYIDEGLPIGSRPVVIMEVEENEQTEGADEIDRTELAQENGLAILLDKLGERLAFERQGARLYEACVQKCESLGEEEGGPSLQDLRQIYQEELEHFKMLQKVISEMGADATVQTPSADVAGVLSQGILQIVNDPRATMTQTLQAMLVAELADNDGWEMLSDLASAAGHSDLEDQCRNALEQEGEHLEKVREWLKSMTLNEAELMDEDAGFEDADKEDEDYGTADESEKRESKQQRTSQKSSQRKSKKSSRSNKAKDKAKK